MQTARGPMIELAPADIPVRRFSPSPAKVAMMPVFRSGDDALILNIRDEQATLPSGAPFGSATAPTHRAAVATVP